MNTPLRRTGYDWVLEILAFLGLLGVFFPLCFWGQLNSQHLIPIHYNLHGQVDGWGNRSDLLILALIALLLYLGLFFSEKFCKKFNYPVRVTDGNADTLYRLAVRMVRHLKFPVMFIFAYLNISSLRTALGEGPGISGGIMGALVVCLFIILIYFYARMMTCRDM